VIRESMVFQAIQLSDLRAHLVDPALLVNPGLLVLEDPTVPLWILT
jgi:hypothetical protein